MYQDSSDDRAESSSKLILLSGVRAVLSFMASTY
jgi:hypothetical protein